MRLARSFTSAVLALIATAGIVRGQIALPKRDLPDTIEIEPPLLIQPAPKPPPPPPSDDDSTPVEVVADNLPHLADELARAVRRTEAGARLVRLGIISQEEEEQRSLQVLRLKAALARRRAEDAKQRAASAEAGVAAGQVPTEDGEKIDNEARAAQTAADEAAHALQQAEIDLAALRLRRRQRLQTLGTATKQEVKRAADSLAELKNKAAAASQPPDQKPP